MSEAGDKSLEFVAKVEKVVDAAFEGAFNALEVSFGKFDKFIEDVKSEIEKRDTEGGTETVSQYPSREQMLEDLAVSNERRFGIAKSGWRGVIGQRVKDDVLKNYWDDLPDDDKTKPQTGGTGKSPINGLITDINEWRKKNGL